MGNRSVLRNCGWPTGHDVITCHDSHLPLHLPHLWCGKAQPVAVPHCRNQICSNLVVRWRCHGASGGSRTSRRWREHNRRALLLQHRVRVRHDGPQAAGDVCNTPDCPVQFAASHATVSKQRWHKQRPVSRATIHCCSLFPFGPRPRNLRFWASSPLSPRFAPTEVSQVT